MNSQSSIRRVLACLLAAVMLLGLALPAVAAAGDDPVFDRFAMLRFRGRKIIGGTVVISRNGEILASSAYGHRNPAQTKVVSVDTCFRVASVTKMVSAVGLIKLMKEKGLGFDTPVSEILGQMIRNPAYPDQPITVRQVLTHTTGFLSTSPYRPNWERLRPDDNKVFRVRTAPGTRYIYSNFNGGLIGAMIEALSGQSVNTYMKENVFGPLGINAAYHPGLLPDQSDVSYRIEKDGSLVITASRAIESVERFEDTCDPVTHVNRTVGDLYISAVGLNRIVSMLQMGGTLDGVTILDEDTVREMLMCQVFEGSSVQVDGEYSLGLARVTGMPGGTWYGHQGRYEGLSANAYFQPDTGLCVSVIANGYEPYCVEGVATVARAFMEYAVELIQQEQTEE